MFYSIDVYIAAFILLCGHHRRTFFSFKTETGVLINLVLAISLPLSSPGNHHSTF
jgi:hypothetical protein